MSTTSEIQAVCSNDESQVVAASDPAQYSGSFFHSSNQVSVTGGMLTSAQSVTNHFHHGPSVGVPQADFRKIPLGDINLRRELRVDDRSVSVYRRHEHGSVHRVYSARVEGRKGDMTVAMFQGKNAEEQWSQTVLEHSSLRHPNIVQLYAVSSSSGIHATVYHDELIPFDHFLNHYRHSHFLLLDLWGYFIEEQEAAMYYVLSVFPQKMLQGIPFGLRILDTSLKWKNLRGSTAQSDCSM
ncbi:hypothetical protein C8F01DRAFT_1250091 [Mycena amicta]|nr:hypothetical protein C8F01DRAFT_1250091 [Mycena amicta]